MTLDLLAVLLVVVLPNLPGGESLKGELPGEIAAPDVGIEAQSAIPFLCTRSDFVGKNRANLQITLRSWQLNR